MVVGHERQAEPAVTQEANWGRRCPEDIEEDLEVGSFGEEMGDPRRRR